MTLTPLEIKLIISTLLEFNPLFQAIKIVRNKHAKDVSLITYLMIIVIGIMWFIYGLQIDSLPLIIGNAIKLFAALSVAVVYIRYRSPVGIVNM